MAVQFGFDVGIDAGIYEEEGVVLHVGQLIRSDCFFLHGFFNGSNANIRQLFDTIAQIYNNVRT